MSITKKLHLIVIVIMITVKLLSAQAEGVVVDLEQPMQSSSALANTEHAASDVVIQLEELQSTVRELRGELELQKHQIQQLHQTQLQLFQDLDSRLQKLSPSVAVKNLNTVQSFSALATPAVKSTLPKKPLATPADTIAYQKAYAWVEQHRYTEAMKALQKFLKQYPHSQFVVNAHYWLGELYGLSGHTKQAIAEFNTVVERFPQHAKAADALLKMGYLYSDQEQWITAQQLLQSVVANYPQSSAARLASQRLQQLSRSGRV